MLPFRIEDFLTLLVQALLQQLSEILIDEDATTHIPYESSNDPGNEAQRAYAHHRLQRIPSQERLGLNAPLGSW